MLKKSKKITTANHDLVTVIYSLCILVLVRVQFNFVRKVFFITQWPHMYSFFQTTATKF